MFKQARLIKPVTPRNTLQSLPTYSQNTESRLSTPCIGDARKEFNMNLTGRKIPRIPWTSFSCCCASRGLKIKPRGSPEWQNTHPMSARAESKLRPLTNQILLLMVFGETHKAKEVLYPWTRINTGSNVHKHRTTQKNTYTGKRAHVRTKYRGEVTK